jgi:hypothetical protein
MKDSISLIFFLLLIFHVSYSQENPKAKVVFIRTFKYLAGGAGFNVYEGSKKLLRVKPQTFEVLDIDAKPTRFWAKTEVKKHLDVNMLPNHVYFVRCKASLGIFLFRPSFETLNEEEFADLVSRRKFLQKKLKLKGFNNAADFLKTNQIVKFSGI